MGKVKSLRDSLLESTVVNFDRIFFGNGGAREVMKHICLPPNMFEDIQDKSHEICWIIPYKSLVACLSSRDSLNWVNIDLRMGALTIDDMLRIAKSDLPIKRLSFLTENLTDAMLKVIEKFSSTIEVLEIDYRNEFEDVDVSHKHLDQTLIKFTKLKVLSVDLSVVPLRLLRRFDLSSCSESVKKLCLHGFIQSSDEKKDDYEKSIMKFVDSLKALKNLEYLTIRDENICEKMYSIVHLKNLRALDLQSVPPGPCLVNILPKLENLTLPKDNLMEELNSLNGKMLNYVSSYFERGFPKDLKQFAKNIGSAEDFKSYLKFMDHSCCFFNYTNKTFCFVETLSDESYQTRDKSILFSGCEIWKVEKAILAHLMWGLFDVEFCVDAIIGFQDIWSHEFMIKVANLVTSLQICEDKRFSKLLRKRKRDFNRLLKHQPLIDYKKGYIALNPNSPLSQLYKMIPPVV